MNGNLSLEDGGEKKNLISINRMILGDHFTPVMPFLPDGSGVFRG